MISIYTLSLSQGKYYVGKSTNIDIRLGKHLNGGGSHWTKKYPPLKLLELMENSDEEDEDKITLRYMKRYGIDNVRGGSFCRLELSKSDRRTLEKMLKTSGDRCYHCNGLGHFASRYPKKSHRCGRHGHYAGNCYAKRDIDGEMIESDSESDY